jgi:Acyl-CoA dehydrogenases
MDFALTDNQEAIRDAIARICSDFDDAYWLKRDREGGFPHDFHKALRGRRLARHLRARSLWRLRLGITEAAIMMRTIAESGAGMSGASAVHINVFGLNPVVVFGTEAQRRRMLPPMVEGREKACFAVTEPNTGLNTTQLKTRAEARNDRYVVNGQKVWISTAQVAHKICCWPAPRRWRKCASRPTASACSIPISIASGSRSMRSRKWDASASIPTSCSSRISKSRWRIASAKKAAGSNTFSRA